MLPSARSGLIPTDAACLGFWHAHRLIAITSVGGRPDHSLGNNLEGEGWNVAKNYPKSQIGLLLMAFEASSRSKLGGVDLNQCWAPAVSYFEIVGIA